LRSAPVSNPARSRDRRQLQLDGVWGTYFWIDPGEKLIAVQMIQVVPGKIGPLHCHRNLAYGAL